MELDRPHFRTTSTGSSSSAAAAPSELFICFTSRLSSSSMKLTKSILSPGRAARDGGPASLSSSLSRRLRTNGSLKGGHASPFFTTTSRKRGCAFENPEPSSPKVTCIGQVRVKTKKKVKQSRSLSTRRSGEVSFRKIEPSSGDGGQQVEDKQRYSNASAHYQQQSQECLPHRNQRWVHLPIFICEALRAFGAEFSCLFPCKSSCFSTSSEKDQKGEKHNGNENSCGAVFARWLVSVNDGEGGKRREIELVVGGGDEDEAERVSIRSSRRHVFEDIEVKDDRIEVKGQSLEGEEEAARVSICIPPKNALLLMRCRSDPKKMADLASRFTWDAPEIKVDDIDEEINVEETVVITQEPVEEAIQVCDGEEAQEAIQVCDGEDEVFGENIDISGEPSDEQENPDEAKAVLEDLCHGENIREEKLTIDNEEMVEEKPDELQKEIMREEEEEVESNMSSFEALLVQENTENYEDCPIQDNEEVEDNLICHLSPSAESSSSSSEVESNIEEAPQESNSSLTETDEENQLKSEHEEEEEGRRIIETEMANRGSEEMCGMNEQVKKEKVLPECLLLMMCEPKLSMEVSKETWVCSRDFIRWLPERPRKPAKPTIAADHEPVKRRLSIDSKPKTFALANSNEQLQPPRSSCSLPAASAAASMATMIEQKLVNAVAYEPFVLTRCKSEPMRTAAAKLMPESCFWKNAMRKLEPHRQGVGAAGVGF